MSFVSRRNAILLAAVLSQVAISLVQFGLPALTFALRDERGVGPVEFGVLFAAIGLGSGVSLIGAGRACDRLGARPVLLVGSVVGAAGLAASGFAPAGTPLAAALFVAGVGGAAVPVAGMTAVLRHFPPERRGTVRIFHARDRVRLALVLRGKRLGFSLEQIAHIVDMYDAEPGEAGQLRYLLEQIDERRAELELRRRDIEETLAELEQVPGIAFLYTLGGIFGVGADFRLGTFCVAS